MKMKKNLKKKKIKKKKKINENKKFIYLSGNEKTKFDEQQNMYNYLIHTADLGHNASKYEISKQWIDLLLQEFFIQGDAERKKSNKGTFCRSKIKTNKNAKSYQKFRF